MEEKELKQECLKLVETVESMYLGTNGTDGTPQIRIMSNMRNPQSCTKAPKELFAELGNSFTAYMITSHSSAEFHTLLLTGTAEEVPDMELKKLIWQDEWKIHWPGGAEDPEFVLLKMSPTNAKGWNKEGPFEFKLK
jgi:general stress protein 26